MDARIARSGKTAGGVADEVTFVRVNQATVALDAPAFAAAIAEGFAAIERGDVLTEEEMELEFERMLADLPSQ